jgi:hypothetical protein
MRHLVDWVDILKLQEALYKIHRVEMDCQGMRQIKHTFEFTIHSPTLMIIQGQSVGFSTVTADLGW